MTKHTASFTDASANLALYIFMGLFLLDPILLLARFTYDVYFPIGFISSILSLILVFRIIFFVKKNIFQKRITVLLIFYFIYVSIIIALSDQSTYDDFLIVINYLLYSSIGFYFLKYLDNKRNINSIKYYIFIYPIIFSVFISTFNIKYLFSLEGLNYLRLADGVCMVGLLALGFTKKIKIFIIILFFYLVNLYLLKARSAIVFFYFASMFILFLRYKKIKIIPLFIVLVIGTYLFLATQLSSIIDINDNRIIRLLFFTEVDSSLLARIKLLENGIEVIKNNIIFGEYGWQTKLFGGRGFYIHNILSFWAQFGIIIFLLTLFIVFYPIFYLVKNKHQVKKELYEYLIVLFLFLALNSIFSKAYTYQVIFMPIGMVLYLSNKQSNSLRSNIKNKTYKLN
ncbi:MAG: O-antigen ligase family protein [Ignavibacteriales bacterium]|nr:O-antigen ligase family protein [Ignavibacteriales bacterium]